MAGLFDEWDRELGVAEAPDGGGDNASASGLFDQWDQELGLDVAALNRGEVHPAANRDEPTPEELGDVEAGDYSRSLAIGLDSFGQTVGRAMQWAGADEAGQWVEDKYKEREEQLRSELTPAFKAEQSKPFLSEKEGELFGEGSTSLAKITGTILESAPSMAVGMGTGALATRLLMRAGMKAGLAGVIGSGIGEGGVAAVQSAKDFEDIIMDAPDERLAQSEDFQEIYSDLPESLDGETRFHAARRKLASEAAKWGAAKVGAATALLGAPSGFGLGKILGGESGKTFLRTVGKQGVMEASQETPQSAYEAYAANEVIQRNVDPSHELTEGVGEAAMGGFITGGVMGVGLGGGAHRVGKSVDLLKAGGEKTTPAVEDEVESANDHLPYNPVPGGLPEVGQKVGAPRATGEAAVRLDRNQIPILYNNSRYSEDAINKQYQEDHAASFPETVDLMGIEEPELVPGKPSAEPQAKTPIPDSPLDYSEEAVSKQYEAEHAAPFPEASEAFGVAQPETFPASDAEASDLPSGVIVRASGSPFKAKGAQVAAKARSKKTGKTWEPVEYAPGKWGVQEASVQTVAAEEPEGAAPFDESMDIPQGELVPERDPLEVEWEQREEARGQSVQVQANEAATSPLNEAPEPSEAQKEAGNYRKGHVNALGMNISIENPVGSERSGTDQKGKPWSVEMKHHYGYIKGTKGKDKDHLDVFLKDGVESQEMESKPVYVVDQVNEDGSFDEHKILMGFDSQEDAEAGYLSNYEDGWQGVGAITEMSPVEFKRWTKGSTTKPVSAKLSGANTNPDKLGAQSDGIKIKSDGKPYSKNGARLAAKGKSRSKDGKQWEPVQIEGDAWGIREKVAKPRAQYVEDAETLAREYAEQGKSKEQFVEDAPDALGWTSTSEKGVRQTVVGDSVRESFKEAGYSRPGSIAEVWQRSGANLKEYDVWHDRVSEKVKGILDQDTRDTYTRKVSADFNPKLKADKKARERIEGWVDEMLADQVRSPAKGKEDSAGREKGEVKGQNKDEAPAESRLGKNKDGKSVYVDDNGVRSVEEAPGIRVQQSVSVGPDGSSFDSPETLYQRGKKEFLTKQELAKYKTKEKRGQLPDATGDAKIEAQSKEKADDGRSDRAQDHELLAGELSEDSESDRTGRVQGTEGSPDPNDSQRNGPIEEDGAGRGDSLDGSAPHLSGAAGGSRRAVAGPTAADKSVKDIERAEENPGNFSIDEDFNLGEGTNSQKIKGNLEAIRVLRKLQEEDRLPTREEQATMARYVGWGGLKSVFDPKKADSKDLYGRAQRELKDLLSEAEYRDAYASVRNAHYTASGVVDAMWRVFRHMGFKGGRALEPTVGTGNFLGLQPADMAASTEWHASELDTVTGQLAAMIYPEANIMAGTGFQDAPFADGVFDVAIGNPPFGSNTIRDRSEHRKHLSGMKVHNYIIAKTGMHLRPGGVMGMVVTHRFLDTANPEARDVLANDFKFLGAIRLPNDAFKANAGTEVVTDIIFLQKLRSGEKADKSAAWLDTDGELDGGFRVNRYFAENPEHILGKSAMDGSMYGGGEEYTVHSDGRDLGRAIDEIIVGSFADLSGALEPTAADKDLAPAMLEQSDLPIGGMVLDSEGRIMRRGMNDESGNAVVEEVTPETPWKDQAVEWEAVLDAAEEVKTQAQSSGQLPDGIESEFNEVAQVAYNKGMKKKASPTRAEAAVYKIRDDIASKGVFFQWDHDAQMETIRDSYKRKQLGEKGFATLKGLLDLRNGTLRLIQEELADGPHIEKLRKELNEAYDAFVKKHGFISAPKNSRLLGGDIGAESGLESSYEAAVTTADYKRTGDKPRKAQATKSDILSQRVNYPRREITTASSSSDALRVSMMERGKVDLPYMASLTGRDINTVIKDLTTGRDPELFYNPEAGEFEDAETYLSGNVKAKLDRAEDGDESRDLTPNIKALKAAQPKPKTKDQVRPNIRGFWIPKQVFVDFLKDLGARGVKVSLLESQGRMVASMQSQSLTDLGLTFRHPDTDLAKLFNAAAAGKSITVMRRDGSETHKDEKATKEVNALINRMGKIFEDWAYSDEGRVETIVEAFNEKMNTHTPRKYDGEKYFKPTGITPSIQLRRTQKNAAWRMIQDPNVLLDHVVGAGKTFTAIAGIMERRRLGFSRKPMVVVPNHLVTQWAQDFYKLFPGAKVLAATPADFAKKNRRRLFARIATGDFDAVIIGHSSLGFIEAPVEDSQLVINEKMDALREVLEEARANKESKRTLTQIQNRIENYKEKLTELETRPKDEMGVNFKDMGIDYLVVDEAHEFKNLEYATAGERVVGMNDPNGSKKAFDLYIKVRGVQNREGGVAFATGTPVSNSLVEIYTIMSYLAHDELVARKQQQFDSWSGAYAATETRLEYTATQKLKERRVLSGLNNLSALQQIYEHFADVISLDDLKRIYTEEVTERNKKNGTNERTEFPLPKVKGGGRQLDTGEITSSQQEYMDYLVARMAAIEANKSDKDYAAIDNALWVLSDARKMSLDIRTVDHSAPRDENGKVARAAERIHETYQKWDDQRGTQLVFCDLSTPSKQAEKGAKKMLKDVAQLVMDKKRASSFLRSLSHQSYADQWETLRERVEAVAVDSETSVEVRDKVEAFFADNYPEDIKTTMEVADTGFSVYDDLKSVLIEKGVPETEIEFIHDHNTPQQKDKLFGRMNNGYVRVLIGSSAKMGAGTNAQQRLVALHHLDAPWRPSDVEQREGRIIRQGNMFYEQDPDNFQVEITAYSTSQTSDTVMWQILERKAGAIEQFRSGEIDSVQEDSNDSDQYAEFMATSTGNPVFKQKLEAERKLDEMSAEIDGALMAKQNAKAFLERYDETVERLAERSASLEGVIAETASYGGESGSASDYSKAMSTAMEQYNKDWAAHQEAMEEYKKAFAKWENAPEKTRGKPPVAPKAPVKPHLMSDDIQAKSGFARAIGKALKKAAYNKTVSVSLEGASVEITGHLKSEDRTVFKAELVTKDGQRMRLETVRAKDAANSSNLAKALTPKSLERDIQWEKSSIEKSLEQVKASKARNEELAKLDIDTSERDALREEVQWLAHQVSFAETETDIERSGRANKYIERDRTRSISQGNGAVRGKPETVTIEGEEYRTTGIRSGSALEAARVKDGIPAIIFERQKDEQRELSVILQPESLRDGKAKPLPEPATDVQFSQVQHKPFRKLKVKAVEAAISRLQKAAAEALPIEVVQSFEDLPDHVKGPAEEEGSGLIGAANDGKKVYMVADNIESRHRAVGLWMHEQGIHRGLRGLFGAREHIQMMNRVYASAKGKRTFKEIADLYGLDIKNNRFDRIRAAEEYLARVAEKVRLNKDLTSRERTTWRRFVKAVAQWLRDKGLNIKLTDAEIALIVDDAVQWTMHGPDGPSGGVKYGRDAAVAFSKGGEADTRVNFSRSGHGADALKAQIDAIAKAQGISVGEVSTAKKAVDTMTAKPSEIVKEAARGDGEIIDRIDMGDLTVLQEVGSLPHWISKRHPTFDAIYRRQLDRMDERASMLRESLEEVEDFFQDMTAKEQAALRDLIWEIDGKELPGMNLDKFIPIKDEAGRPVRENGRTALEMNPAYYEAFEKWVDSQRVPDKVKRALNSLRVSLDRDFLRAYDAMREMAEIDNDTIKAFRTNINHVHNYFPHKRYGAYNIQAMGKNRVDQTKSGKWAVYNASGDIVSDEFSNKETAQKHLAKNKQSVVYREHFDARSKKAAKVKAKKLIAQRKEAVKGEGLTWSQGENEGLPDEIYEYPIDSNAMEQVLTAAADKIEDQKLAKEIKGRLSEAVAETMKSRGWSAATIGRKGIPGHETEDVQKIIYDYKAGLTGWLTKMQASRDFTQLLGKIDAKDNKRLYVYSTTYVQNMLRNSDKVDRTVGNVKALAFLWYLGFNVKTAALNLTQNIIVGIPRLSMDVKGGGVKYWRAAMATLVEQLTSKATGGKSKTLPEDEMKLLKELYREDVITEGFLNEVKGRVQGVSVAAIGNKVLKYAGMPMAIAERFNRASLALAAFRAARDGHLKGERAGKKMGYEDAKAFAEDIVRDSHFVYGKTNLPQALRNSTAGRLVGNPMYTFRTFSHNLLSVWNWMLTRQGGAGRSAFAKSMVGTMAIGGFTALPFYATLVHLVQWLAGDDDDPTEEIRKRMPDSDILRDMVTYGLPAGTGFSLGGSVGLETPVLSRIEPGATVEEGLANNLGDILGIPYDLFFGKPSRVSQALKAGDNWRAFEEAAPTIVRNAMAGYRLWEDGQRSMSGKPINEPGEPGPRKLGKGEAIGKAIGFQPISSRKSYDRYRARKVSKMVRSNKATELANRFVRALRDRDQQRANEILTDLKDWNREMVSEGKPWMLITLQDMSTRVRSRSKGRGVSEREAWRIMEQRKAY